MILKTISLVLCLQLSLAIYSQNEYLSGLQATKPEQVKNDPSLSAPLRAVHDLTIYPPIENMTKNAIFLDPLPDETLYKVELYVVKSLEVDNCNKHYLFGDFEVRRLDGFGFSYFIFNSNSNIISTKMGCGDDIKKIRNVASGKTEIVRYISAMPIVVYTPKDMEVKYKLWKVDPKEMDARSFR